MKWYYVVLITLVVLILAAFILGIVVDKVIFKGSFSKLIGTLINAKRGNLDVNLSKDNLSSFSDNDLNLEILFKINSRFDGNLKENAKMTLLNSSEKTFYVVMLYEIEFQDGGLYQYFVNSSKDTAPYLSNELVNLGAEKIENEFSSFVSENNINLNELSEFDTNTHEEYMTVYEAYPFEGFDIKAMEIYEEENLEVMLANFVRENISDFID